MIISIKEKHNLKAILFKYILLAHPKGQRLLVVRAILTEWEHS